MVQIPNFIKAWDKFIGTDRKFDEFVIHHAPVPKQDLNFFKKYDDGVFTMKFLESWDPRVNLVQKFSSSHIGDIRIMYISDMVFSPHKNNKKAKGIVRNHQGVVSLFSLTLLLMLDLFIFHSFLLMLHLFIFCKHF
jgi:hypothetical protein